MRVVDEALLGDVGRGQKTDGHPERLALGGLIGGDPYLPVWVGETGIDPLVADKVRVSYDVPFATYTSGIGEDANPRLSGRKGRRSVPFYLIYVGSTLEQAKWAGERLRDQLERTRLVIPGYRTYPIGLQPGGSQRVRRDDNVMRPDGSPLWYGIDSYAVSLSLTFTTGVTA